MPVCVCGTPQREPTCKLAPLSSPDFPSPNDGNRQEKDGGPYPAEEVNNLISLDDRERTLPRKEIHRHTIAAD